MSAPTYTVLCDGFSLEESLRDCPDILAACRKIQRDMEGMKPSEVAMAMVVVIQKAGIVL
jgi:hypothetical protein